jgi:uncharacterized lipoprotein NlpE involved in copper resistance
LRWGSGTVKILIDENLPRHLKQVLAEHEVFTVQEMGWAGIENGALLERANTSFQVLLTADQNLRYQQNLSRMNIAIVVFPSNRLKIVMRLIGRLKDVLMTIRATEIVEL